MRRRQVQITIVVVVPERRRIAVRAPEIDPGRRGDAGEVTAAGVPIEGDVGAVDSADDE